MRPTPRTALVIARALPPAFAVLLALLAGPAPLRAQPGEGDFPGMSSRSEGPRVMPMLVFFPPYPPPLDRPIARPAGSAGRAAAPAELAAYVNEPFYPALGTQLAGQTLSAKLRARLDEYRAAKVALQAELRAELDRGRNADAASRTEQLAAFAQRQEPKVVALEATAEQLRRDLIVGDQAWGALRQWRLGDKERRGFSPFEIAQVMRSYAFYQAGLLPAQRRLLREISIELVMAGENTTNATAQQPYLFFPPEPARVLLPDDVPADVAAKVATYQTKKSKLKKELYDAVYAHDGQKLGFLRGNSLKTLADQQAPALLELDTLAEDIRRALARVAEPTAIAERSPLPPTLQHRVAALMADYTNLQKEATARIEAILAEARELPMQTTYRFEGDGLKFLVIPTRGARGSRGGPGGAPDSLARINEVRTQLSAIADDYGRRVIPLLNEKESIRNAIAQTLGPAKAAGTDSALLSAMRVVTARETEGQYREYRIAVFQPGLSPAQRRLLFDSVVEQLALPLPRGELQPIVRGNSW